MLKLDLTGQSSHVSFSRNILNSSRRALHQLSKDRSCQEKIKNLTVWYLFEEIKVVFCVQKYLDWTQRQTEVDSRWSSAALMCSHLKHMGFLF